MKLVAITGGVGMGKSTSAALWAQFSIPVVDTDELARALVEPGQPALAEIEAAFGPSILTPEGRLDRGRLAERVFTDPLSKARVEAILHPRIRQEWQHQTCAWETEGRPLGCVVIPLLYETCAETHFDQVICVACTRATQLERLSRRGWSQEHARRRMDAQMPTEEKIRRANAVVWAEGSHEVHAEQVRLLVHRLLP